MDVQHELGRLNGVGTQYIIWGNDDGQYGISSVPPTPRIRKTSYTIVIESARFDTFAHAVAYATNVIEEELSDNDDDYTPTKLMVNSPTGASS